jgi:hypothetical protein
VCLAAPHSGLPFTFEKCGSTGVFAGSAPGFRLFVSPQAAVFELAGKPGATVRMSFEGTGRDGTISAENALPGKANYFLGNNPRDWRTGVEQFGRLRLRGVFPGTDIVFYGSEKRPEFDVILKPGADLALVRFRFTGTTPSIDGHGDLLLRTVAGDIVEHRPIIEQDGKQVEGRFQLQSDGSIGFVTDAYDHHRELRIDPSITYSTYLGGASDDSPNAIAVDAAGNTYIAGTTSSYNFPVTAGSLETLYPGTFETVAFVAKLNAAGTGLIYTTFLGGNGFNGGDSANGIAVDGNGNVYVAGTTGSTNFPVTAGALATSLSGPTDGFVAKINPAGTALVYSTLLGGSSQESVTAITLDVAGNAYVTGSTGSTNFPVTSGAPQMALKSANDAFISKLNPAGTMLVYSTFLGGSAEDDAYAIALDGAGSVYVTGSTASADFPVTSAAFKKTGGPAAEAFVAKLTPAGTGLAYSTYLGGTGGDAGNGIAVDSAGNAYIAGTTYSADFPVTSGVIGPAVPGTPSYGHVFLTKLNPAASALVYSTFLGGVGSDGANGLALDASGDAILTGFTYSANFPVTSYPAETVANYAPAAYLTKINPTATSVLYSTLLGATGYTAGQALAVDSGNHAYVAGYTGSTTFPVSPGAFQISSGVSSPGAETGFVTKVDLGSATSCSFSFSPASASFPVGGGSVVASVTAPAGCAWEAVGSSGWVTIGTPASGVGPGTVTFTAGSNEMNLAGRSTSITAGPASLILNQLAGSCNTPQFLPVTQSMSSAGGTGSVAVTIPAGCAVTAVSGAAWITINSGGSANGDDLVIFTAAPNPGNARSGTITIAGVPYTVMQAGAPCATSLTPTSTSLPGGGGSITATLVAPSGCSWTAASTGAWLTVSPTSGAGSATVTLSAPPNLTAAPLNATVTASGLSFSVSQPVNSPPVLHIESPVSGASVYGTVSVSGWAIDNATPIATIQINIDGVTAGYATSTSRADVCAAYGSRPGCPNVGFVYSLNTSSLSSGAHTISVIATDSDTVPDAVTGSVSVNVANTPPLLNLESPASGANISGQVIVSGWAIDNLTPVASVQIKVDGNLAGNAAFTARPDVCAAYGGKPGCPNVGFSYTLNTAAYSNGTHTITVGATDADATPLTSVNSVTVKIANNPPQVNLESPGQGAVVSGTVSISGWAIDSLTPISGVQVKVDGVAVGIATATARPDVCAAYGARPGCPNVGFSYSWNTASYSNGNHTVSVTATDTDAAPLSSTASTTVNIGNAPPLVNLESPVSGALVSGVITVSGWAIDGITAIAGVQVKVDGIVIGNASFTARPDVCAAYGTRPGCPNVGFVYSVNTSTLSSGTHTISVVATDSDSVPDSSTASATVIVGNSPPTLHIDGPASGAVVSGTVSVTGWAIDSVSAISSIQVKVDGAVVGNANYGLSRPDVCTVYPGRQGCPNVGFSYSLNTSTLATGTHTITLIASDSESTPASASATVTIVVAVPPSVYIEFPASGSTVSGTVNVAGWAINSTGGIGTPITAVQVKLDGTLLGNASYNVARPDVCGVFPGRPNCPNVGFIYSLNTGSIASGTHILTVSATDSDATPVTGSASITVVK